MDAAIAGATDVLTHFISRGAGIVDHRQAPAVARLVVDTVGVAVAAADTSPVAGLRRWLDTEGMLTSHPGGAVVWGRDERVAPTIAALLNATAGHALDWDDASPSIPSHPATVLLPAILAVAPGAVRDRSQPVDGNLIVRAYGVGSAVLRAVAQALPDADHYARGWHTTATVGRLAAVASVAVMTGLDEHRTRLALGVVASMMAGSRANFGTDIKSVHAGLAARDAVAAVGMVRAGLTAHPGILEHPNGVFALYGSREPDAAELAGLLDHWADGWLEDYAIKVYPSCYGTHRALDGLIRLRSAGLRAEDVESVHVTVETGWLAALRRTDPTTGLEAKFSLPYTAAVALLEGAVGLDDFEDEALDRPGRRHLMARVTSAESAHPPLGGPADGSWAVVRVVTTAGEILQTRVDATHGDARNPLTADAVFAKFADDPRS